MFCGQRWLGVITLGNASPTNEELILFVRKWLGLLADGSLEEACAQQDEPNSYGVLWSPAAILRAVSEEFGPETVFGRRHPEGPRFSRPDEVSGSGRPSVLALADGSGFSVEHDVPLNDTYSDLTAEFTFRRRGARFAFVVQDLHVK